MESYRDQINSINTSYLKQTDLKLLHDELICLDALLAIPTLDARNRANADALRLRLDAKICLLQYVSTFSDTDYRKALEHYAESLAAAKEKNYGNTIDMLEEAQRFTVNLCGLAGEVWQHKQLFATNGANVLDTAMCNRAIQAVQRAKELLKLCNLKVATPYLVLGDLPQITLGFLEQCNTLFGETRTKIIATKLASSVKDISGYRDNTYFPLPENDEGGKANALVLSTPLVDDARLFAVNQCANGRKLLCVSVYSLTDKSVDFFQMLLDYVCGTGDYCILEGVDTLPIETSDAVLLQAMRVGKLGTKVFITDTSGKAQLYKQALELAVKDDNAATVTDVSLEYISLPVFSEVKQLFEEREMTDTSTSSEVLKKMPFMGFYGLNQVVKAFVARDKHWQDVGKHASGVNRQAVLNYLEHIPAAYLIIDSGWGDYSQYDKDTDGGVHEFDYDGVKDVDLYNVKQIVESNESVFAKCGMIARYCTIGSDDVSAWGKITRDEMLERITMAVKLVYKVLRVDINPMVELLDELSNPTAGGLCCDGGKVIQFKYNCAVNAGGWLWGAIVHECFHSLQSKLTHGMWHNWYFDNMGISRGRVMEWKKTREIYDHDTNSKIYSVHIYEADARAFEVDCDDGCNKAWNSMNFR